MLFEYQQYNYCYFKDTFAHAAFYIDGCSHWSSGTFPAFTLVFEGIYGIYEENRGNMADVFLLVTINIFCISQSLYETQGFLTEMLIVLWEERFLFILGKVGNKYGRKLSILT